MNKNEQFIITINRELGSGGRSIGEKLAKTLNVPFFDKALVKALRDKYNLTIEEIEKLKGKKVSWWNDIVRAIQPFYNAAKEQYYKEPEEITSGEIFRTESQILKEIGEKESCVIAGRSGFFIFRDHPNHISILIQAPMEYRINRLMTKYNKTREESIKSIQEVDTWRENYIKRNTNTSRYDARNYDLVINMEDLTEDNAVELILDFIDKTNSL